MTEWRAVPDYPNYLINDRGDIRSIGYRDARGFWRKPRTIGGGIDGSGYRQVALVNAGGQSMRKVHRLLCEAWHGPCPTWAKECRHLDGDSLHNTPDNLQWGTGSQNQQDSLRHGTQAQARKTHCPREHEYPTASIPGKSRRCRPCENAARRKRG